MTNSCHKGKKIWRSTDLSRKNEMIKSPRTQNPIGPLQFVKTVYKAIRFLGVYCVPVFTGLLRAYCVPKARAEHHGQENMVPDRYDKVWFWL